MPDMQLRLTPTLVEETFRACLYDKGEPTEGAKIVEGIVMRVGFDPARVATHRETIGHLLAELPEQFRKGSGGGWTFLNACNDRHGEMWTGEHRTMEMLFLLGMATGRVECLLPREFWDSLPGGVPYYAITEGES
jgi:hypothetical protein